MPFIARTEWLTWVFRMFLLFLPDLISLKSRGMRSSFADKTSSSPSVSLPPISFFPLLHLFLYLLVPDFHLFSLLFHSLPASWSLPSPLYLIPLPPPPPLSNPFPKPPHLPLFHLSYFLFFLWFILFFLYLFFLPSLFSSSTSSSPSLCHVPASSRPLLLLLLTASCKDACVVCQIPRWLHPVFICDVIVLMTSFWMTSSYRCSK